MKIKQFVILLLICAVFTGALELTASAREVNDQIPEQNEQTAKDEPNLIVPTPEQYEDRSQANEETGEPLVIAPGPTATSDVAEKEMVNSSGLLIIGLVCAIGITTIVVIVYYKKK